jgi:serine protease Do
MKRLIELRSGVVVAVWLLLALGAPARAAEPPKTDSLTQFSDSVQSLVARVTPSVVQVLVTGYGPLEPGRGDTGLVIGRQRSLGSGVVVAPDGYIVTNAHVVAGAQRVQIVLPASASVESPLETLTSERGTTFDARVVGVTPEVDLALLKIDASGLPVLPLADYDRVRAGEVVLAFGSPEGLRNSVTMGVVSAVARQPVADRAMVYVQTDAPINPGNSGGALVNVRGELVGINTFILSQSGGSQGLGFAIPSAIVKVVCAQLRTFGHLHRGEIGLDVQTLTTDLARSLGITSDGGVIVSDLLQGGPADTAGLKIGDIILSVDGHAMNTPVELAFHLYSRAEGDRLKITARRDGKPFVFDVAVMQRPQGLHGLGDRIDPETSLVRQLGVLGLTIDKDVADLMPGLRATFGVMVVAGAEQSRAADVSLKAGDVIHSVNGTPVTSLENLRMVLDALPAHAPVALQIERDGKLRFVTFELD